MTMRLRAGKHEDLPFAEEMLFEAFFWDPAAVRPSLEVFGEEPEFRKLLAGWGRPGDRLVIAEDDGERLGAAWYRLWTAEVHSYGFVDDCTPEVAMGVRADRRSRGIGRLLLAELLRTARQDGFAALSLSVSPGNYARHLYEALGFRKVGEEETSWTYLLRHQARPCTSSQVDPV